MRHDSHRTHTASWVASGEGVEPLASAVVSSEATLSVVTPPRLPLTEVPPPRPRPIPRCLFTATAPRSSTHSPPRGGSCVSAGAAGPWLPPLSCWARGAAECTAGGWPLLRFLPSRSPPGIEGGPRLRSWRLQLAGPLPRELPPEGEPLGCWRPPPTPPAPPPSSSPLSPSLPPLPPPPSPFLEASSLAASRAEAE